MPPEKLKRISSRGGQLATRTYSTLSRKEILALENLETEEEFFSYVRELWKRFRKMKEEKEKAKEA